MESEEQTKRPRGALRLIPHWIAWPLMLLGIWYLPLPLGGYYWSAYLLGIGLAIGCGIWARRTFRVNVVEHDGRGTLIRIERTRPKPKARARKILRLAVIAVVAFFALTALANQFLVKPRAGTNDATGIPPTLNDSGPLPSIEGPSGESRIEPKLTHVAAVISGYGTEVRCWSVDDWRKREREWGDWKERRLGEWGAYTMPWRPPLKNAYRIHLSPSICASLARLVYEDVPAQQDPWPEALAWSVAALAHESQHARGIFDEAVAECLRRAGDRGYDPRARQKRHRGPLFRVPLLARRLSQAGRSSLSLG